MGFREPQTPGIGLSGSGQLTPSEVLTVQNISALGDPGADRILFWDASAGSFQYLEVGANLTITGTTLDASGGGGGSPGGSDTQLQYNNSSAFGGISGATSDGTNLTVLDANFIIADDGDATKKLKFQVSGITTGTTRTVTLPDASGTMTLLGNSSTGSGSVVLATSPVLVTPNLGTPSAVTLTNATGLPVSTGISGLGTGVATALAVNVGSAGAFVTFNGALGTPSSATLTNATGLPISTGVSGLGTGVATFLATPSSANLASAITDETGSGALVFGTSPTFTTSIITPKIVGGSATTGTLLTIQTTSGNGTTDQIVFAGGNNGATTFATLKANSLDLGTSAVLGTGTIELGAASDTTVTRSSAGVIAVEGVEVPLNSVTNTHTAQQIELGHASDTTVSRGAAGFIAVEGKRVPSPASQAAGDMLYRGSTEWERLAKGTAGQVLTMNAGATAPEWAAASGGSPAGSGTELQYRNSGAFGAVDSSYSSTTKAVTLKGSALTQQTLTDGATINWDASSGAYAKVTLGGNRTLAAPTNLTTGGRYILEVIQDASAPRTLSWNSAYKFPGSVTPVLSASNNAVDVFEFYSPDGTNLRLISAAFGF